MRLHSQDQAIGAWEKKRDKQAVLNASNYTLRQRVSPLVRKVLSLSKKLENPDGAVWYLVHHYNATPTASS